MGTRETPGRESHRRVIGGAPPGVKYWKNYTYGGRRRLEQPPSGFVAGLTSGWTALLGLLVVMSTVLGAVLPFLPVIAALGLIGWWLARRGRSRVGQRAPAPAPADGAGQ